MRTSRHASEHITEQVTSWPGVEARTAEDVIAMLRLNYDRVVERYGLPSAA